MFIEVLTVIAVLAVQVGGYALWRSYFGAMDRAAKRRDRVVTRATHYTGPTYSPWGNEQ